MFQIMRISELGAQPHPVLNVECGGVCEPDERERPKLYPNGKEAAADADRWNTYMRSQGLAIRYRVQKVEVPTDAAWVKREFDRFANGIYSAVPWGAAAWWRHSELQNMHFAHLSLEKDGMIAYTPDPAAGEADRQVRARPGRYLKRFYGDKLDDAAIAAKVALFDLQFDQVELRFAATPDEIEQVYVEGPYSCMAHPAKAFVATMHPVRAYAAGDLAVAYIERGGKITARAVCWPEKKRYGRLYGDNVRLEQLLKARGFGPGSMAGARLLRVEDGKAVIVPYLDGPANCVLDEGTHLLIVEPDAGDEVPADSTTGLLSLGMFARCAYCHRDIRSENRAHDVQGEWFCDACFDEHVQTCDDCLENYSEREHFLDIEGGMSICQSCYDCGNYTTCEGCRHAYGERDTLETADGVVLCLACAGARARVTPCGDVISHADKQDCACDACRGASWRGDTLAYWEKPTTQQDLECAGQWPLFYEGDYTVVWDERAALLPVDHPYRVMLLPEEAAVLAKMRAKLAKMRANAPSAEPPARLTDLDVVWGRMDQANASSAMDETRRSLWCVSWSGETTEPQPVSESAFEGVEG